MSKPVEQITPDMVIASPRRGRRPKQTIPTKRNAIVGAPTPTFRAAVHRAAYLRKTRPEVTFKAVRLHDGRFVVIANFHGI